MVADPHHQIGRMGDEHDRAAVPLELLHLRQALGLEGDVADGQDLVDQEDRGIDVHGDGEPQPDVHPAGIELDLGVHEVLQLGEPDDVVEQLVGAGPREAQDRRVQVDVLPAGQLGVEARAQRQEGGDAAPGVDGPLGGSEDPRTSSGKG